MNALPTPRPPTFGFQFPTRARAARRAAFSLTEVVVALGIFAVSMVGVLALFPVASSTGRESAEETQATILAQMILDEIRDSANQRGASQSYTISGPDTSRTTDWLTINLRESTNYYVAYDVQARVGNPTDGVGMMGSPIALKAIRNVPPLTGATFSNGLSNAAFLTRIQIYPRPDRAGLAEVLVQVDVPGTLASTNRRSYYYSSQIFGR